MADVNPFVYSRPVAPEDVLDREPEIRQLLSLAGGGHYVRLYAPRRFGKTSLLRKEGRDHTGENVAAAGGRERRRAERADPDAFARRGDQRVGALQQADAAEAVRHPASRLEAVRGDPARLLSDQAPGLALVRRQHRVAGP